MRRNWRISAAPLRHTPVRRIQLPTIRTQRTTTILLVFAAARLTFFTLGRKYLVPHEPHLRVFDMLYIRSDMVSLLLDCSAARLRRRVHRSHSQDCAPRAARAAGDMQTGVLGVNGTLMLAVLLILLILIAIWSV